ncbi:MAG: DUF302 domain-containing protein [Halobacteriales archaeon]|nr:DUF302 domain-containing protein [Halobacteriales archaeon]
MDQSPPGDDGALHLTLDVPFEDAVPYVQLEHEYVGYETVQVSRLDEMIAGHLDEAVPPTALLVVCHAELAHAALEIDPRLGGMLPCTTLVYEDPDDGLVHVHHASVAKAIRDLGVAPSGSAEAVDALVERSGVLMSEVWANVEAHVDVIARDDG